MIRKIVVALVLCFTLNGLYAQLPPPVSQAMQKLQAGDAAGAITLLEEFTKANPKVFFAYNVLGNAYLRSGNPEKALENYEKATQGPGIRAQAWLNIAAIHASEKRSDQAFEYLSKVRATGSIDFDSILADARFESLRSDPRMAKLRPKPEDFADPFVEPVKVIHEFVGESKNAQFGWIARRIGDVDGDKVADFTLSAPTHPIDGKPAGRIYVFSSKSGKQLWQRSGTGAANLGIGIEAAGDVNRDGIPDVVAGAPGLGKAFVYSGKDGAVILEVGPGDPADLHGRHVIGVGDVNGDGHADFLVGAPSHKGKGPNTGRAYVYSGKDGSVLRVHEGEEANDNFGVAVGGGNGRLIVGAPGAGPRNTGRVYVYDKLAEKPTFTFDSDETGSSFGGMFISHIGDANKDRIEDIFVSDFGNAAKGPSTGRAYLYSGKDGKPLGVWTGERATEGFGIGGSDAGDVNRDGHADLIIGTWQSGKGALSAGKVSIYSGKDGKLLREITSKSAGDTFGFDTTNVGDVDGDRLPDFLVTSAWSGVNGFQSGRAFIISGAPVTTKAQKRK